VIAELLVVFSQICAPIHNEDFRAKKQTYSLVGSGLSHESLGSNDSRRLYDERPVGRSRRTADASRLSAGFRAKNPSVDPTRSHIKVFQTDRKQTDTQSMQSALSVVRGNECKIIVNEKNAVQFCGSDARSLAVGNYSCCTDFTYQRNTFGIAVTFVKLKMT